MSDTSPNRNGVPDGDPTTFGSNPSPPPELFFGADCGNSSTGAHGNPDHDGTPGSTLQHGQLTGLEPLGTDEQDVVDSGVPGGHPSVQAQGGSVAFTQPGSWLSRLGYQTEHAPQNSPEPTTWQDPFNDMGFGIPKQPHFGAIEPADSHGQAPSYDSSGAGEGHVEEERP